MALAQPIGDEQQAAGDQQRTGDKPGIIVEVVDVLLNGQDRKQRDSAHDDQQHHTAGRRGLFLRRIRVHQRGAAPEELLHHGDDIVPVIDKYGDQGAQMEHYIQKQVGLFGRLQAEEILKQRQVAGAGDGQELRNALNQAEKRRIKIVQHSLSS